MDPVGKHSNYKDDISDGENDSLVGIDDDFQDDDFVRSPVQRSTHRGMTSCVKISLIGILLAVLLTLGSESLIHKNGLRNNSLNNIGGSSGATTDPNNSAATKIPLSDREQALIQKEQELADREKAAKEKEEAIAQKHAEAEAREKAVAEREKAAEQAEQEASEHHAAAQAREKAVVEREKAAEEAAKTQTAITTPQENEAPPSDGQETKESDEESPTEETTAIQDTETVNSKDEPKEEIKEIEEETTESEEKPTPANEETIEIQEKVVEDKTTENKEEIPVVEEKETNQDETKEESEKDTTFVEEEQKEYDEMETWNKLSPTKQKQIENYRNQNALILNVGVPHHGGTAMCTVLGTGAGSTPGFVCTEDKFGVMPDPPECRVGDSETHTPEDPPFCYSFNEMHREQMPWLSNQTAPFVEAIHPYFKFMNWHFMNPVGREKYDKGRSLESPDWKDPRLVSVIVTRDPLARLLAGDGGLTKKYPGYNRKELGHSQWWDYAVYDDSRNSDNFFLRILGTVHRHERTPEEEAIENHARHGIPRTTDEVMEMFPTGIDENHYNRAKKVLDQFTFVLDIDCLEEGMEAVGKMLRMGQIEPQVIPAHPHASETPKERIQFDDVYEYLRAKNEWDIKLYEYSKTISLVKCPPKQTPTQQPVEAPLEEANEEAKEEENEDQEITEPPTITFTSPPTGSTAPPTELTAPPTASNNVI
uniref:Sulfotransferase domain-containing protein n=1 Tax=Pseudo-nitzschia delicatissima TaxID=44447 RepID=A0A7S0XQ33_9STRA|mmetsp:Transcript_1590/g.3715  ORF Transcript_1590/g.3715 Transcript_1590/m.3715 type:complete len:708 (+) Transcript_1590:110-2233(+)